MAKTEEVSIVEELSKAEEGNATVCSQRSHEDHEDPTWCSSTAVNLTQKIWNAMIVSNVICIPVLHAFCCFPRKWKKQATLLKQFPGVLYKRALRAVCLLIIAEVIGTYFVIFAGCGSVAVNKIYGSVTFPGVCITWGLIVMVMVYSVGHISGAHFNPAVTITFAIFRRFPLQQVPLYLAAQLLGSVLSSGTLRLLFDSSTPHFFGTMPVDSNLQSLVLEIIITFLLMFVISGVATDSRAIGELAGIAVGATILLNVLIAGPISGASMNPARSIGPAIVMNQYKGLWIYIVGPIVGAIAGGFVYNLIRFTDKPLREIARSGSFLKSLSKNRI